MSDGESNKTITRGALYALVWSKPLTEIAQQFGTTTAEITRLCDRVLRVPRPKAGHWQRLARGKAQPRPELPPADGKIPDMAEIRSYQPETSIKVLIRDALAAEGGRTPVVLVDRNFGQPHPEVVTLLAGRSTAELSPIEIRRYATRDAFLKTMELRGHKFSEKPGDSSFSVSGQEVSFGFCEPDRMYYEPLSAKELREPINIALGSTRRKVLAPSGLLRFEAIGPRSTTFKLSEKPGELLDTQVSALVLAMEIVAQKSVEAQRRSDEWNQQWQAKIEAKIDIRHQEWIDAERWRRLRKMARNRHKATQVRAFLADLAAASGRDQQLIADVEELSTWADNYLWGLDPLSGGPGRVFRRLSAPVQRPDFHDVEDLLEL